MARDRIESWRTSMILVMIGLVLLAILLALRGILPAPAAAAVADESGTTSPVHVVGNAARLATADRGTAPARLMDMDAATMRRQVEAWYAQHPAHGGTLTAATTDTFLVGSFYFDTDGNIGTQVDTARIEVGQTILFKWVDGSHTTTSGQPGDLDAGSLWDHPIDGLTPDDLEFAVAFPNAGTFPFFCRPHGAIFDMKGVVVVSDAQVSVPPASPTRALGFTRAPAPNPSRGGVAFEFRIARGGATRIEIFDAGGRRVATALAATLAAGIHGGAWDGRGLGGAPVGAGVYYLRLTAPDIDQTRSVTIER